MQEHGVAHKEGEFSEKGSSVSDVKVTDVLRRQSCLTLKLFPVTVSLANWKRLEAAGSKDFCGKTDLGLGSILIVPLVVWDWVAQMSSPSGPCVCAFLAEPLIPGHFPTEFYVLIGLFNA